MEITLIFVLFAFTGHAVSLSSLNKVYTYFSDDQMSWNQAREICHERGLALVSPLTASDLSTLFEYRESIWKSAWLGGRSDDIWTSLHSPDGDPEGLFWDDCNPLQSGHSALGSLDTSKSLDKPCIRMQLKATQKWVFEACDRAKVVICENVTANCDFVPQDDTVVDSFINQSISCVQDVCAEYCRTTEYLGKECWAYSYEQTTNCTLYFSDSRDQVVADPSGDRNVDLNVKTCYRGVLNEVDLGVDQYNSVTKPVSNCNISTVSTQTASSMSVSSAEDITLTTEAFTSVIPVDTDATVTTEAITTVTPVDTDATVTTEAFTTVTPVDIDTTITTEAISVTPMDTDTTMTTEATRDTIASALDTTVTKVSIGMETLSSTDSPSDSSESLEQSAPPTTMTKSTSTHFSTQNATSVTSTTKGETITVPSWKTGTQTFSAKPTWVTELSSSTQGDYYSSMLPSSPSPTLSCNCQCPPRTNQTIEEKESFITGLLNELNINTSTISSTRRRKTSAADERVSSLGIGVLGGVFLSLPFIFIVVTDLMTIKAQLNVFG